MSWNIDYAHSSINIAVRHMMISTVRGQFEKFTGTVSFDEHDPTKTEVDILIDATSINTNDEKRDAHLVSPDFFDVENYKTIHFVSRAVEVKDENNARLIGDLTIRGITRPVVLDVEFLGQAKSPWGTTSFGYAADTKISRKDWNLTWNVALETGGMLVGDEIKISIELELVKTAELEAMTA